MKALDVYKPPFKSDGVFIWSSNEVMALMDVSEYDNSEEMMYRLAAILNGEIEPASRKEYEYKGPDICLGGKALFVVRGWGHLTGQGGLGLTFDEAIAMQDEFAQWVISKLQGV